MPESGRKNGTCSQLGFRGLVRARIKARKVRELGLELGLGRGGRC